MNLIGIRSKMGFEIRCYAVSGGTTYQHQGATVHVASDKAMTEAGFYAAWGETFAPWSCSVQSVKAFRNKGRVSCKFVEVQQ